MGLFGGSKSSQTASTGQAGAQTQAGHANSINVSGGKYTSARVTINNRTTDFGAVAEAFDFGRDSLDFGKEVLLESVGLARSAVASNEAAFAEMAAFAEQTVEDSGDKLKNLMPWAMGFVGVVMVGGAYMRGGR